MAYVHQTPHTMHAASGTDTTLLASQRYAVLRHLPTLSKNGYRIHFSIRHRRTSESS